MDGKSNKNRMTDTDKTIPKEEEQSGITALLELFKIMNDMLKDMNASIKGVQEAMVYMVKAARVQNETIQSINHKITRMRAEDYLDRN